VFQYGQITIKANMEKSHGQHPIFENENIYEPDDGRHRVTAAMVYRPWLHCRQVHIVRRFFAGIASRLGTAA